MRHHNFNTPSAARQPGSQACLTGSPLADACMGMPLAPSKRAPTAAAHAEAPGVADKVDERGGTGARALRRQCHRATPLPPAALRARWLPHAAQAVAALARCRPFTSLVRQAQAQKGASAHAAARAA